MLSKKAIRSLITDIPSQDKKMTICLFLCCVIVFGAARSYGESRKVGTNYVSTEFNSGDFNLFDGNKAASIYIDPDDHKVCHLAVGFLSDDIERVCGKKPEVLNKLISNDEPLIIVGTLGKNKLIDRWVGEGLINVDAIEGQWETFFIQTHSNIDGLESILLIVGSDRRATAYGVFDLSENIGVSPWYYWADAAPKTKDKIFIKSGTYKQGPPSVKYRGIFINDPSWSLGPWAKLTLKDEGIGPKTYTKIFELLLRLKGNYIWPSGTDSMFDMLEKQNFADDYAIVVGSSHCEQMLRNNTKEWAGNWKPSDGSKRGSWDWSANKEQIIEYWQDRVEVSCKYENIYTVGMRGVLDIGMKAGDEDVAGIALVMQEEVIPAQRDMIKKWVNSDVEKVPQILVVYKEVMDIYDQGMEVPDDVTLMWCNDNFGYIRRLSNQQEQKRSGHAGIYYHCSYLGNPHEYVWLYSTHPELIWHEMTKAYQHGADRVWMLNVGGLKPREIGVDVWLNLAWDIDKYANSYEYMQDWAEKTFGEEFSNDIADILLEYFRLALARKPEHTGWNNSMFPVTPIQDPEYSLFDYGDESEQRVADYKSICGKADAIYDKLPAQLRDSYYQLVLYPVRCATFMNVKMLYAHRSRVYADQGRTSADYYAEKAQTAHEQIIKETDYYNNELAGGKWNKMIMWNPRSPLQPIWDKPNVGTARHPSSVTNVGIAIEGQKQEIPNYYGKEQNSYPKISNNNILPTFDKYIRQSYFIDIFSKGLGDFTWKVDASNDWIILSQTEGIIDGRYQNRLWVSIDWDKVPSGELNGQIVFNSVVGKMRQLHGMDRVETVMVNVFNPLSPSVEELDGAFISVDGTVSIEANHYTRTLPGKDCSWVSLERLARTGGAVSVSPFTAAAKNSIEEIKADSPVLEYDFYMFEQGDHKITVFCLPAHPVSSDYGLRYAVSIDDAKPQVINFAADEWTPQWDKNVLRGAAITESVHQISKGRHVLKIWMVDPGVVIDKIIIGEWCGYLGAPETRVVKP